MASADFLTRIPTPHDVSSTMAPVRISPGMTLRPSRLYLSDLRYSAPCKFRALTILAASPRCNASYPLPVRQASALPSASSRFAVTRDTLAVRLTLPLAGRVEDFHLQVSAPCRAHQKKRVRMYAPPTPTERQKFGSTTGTLCQLINAPNCAHAARAHVDLGQPENRSIALCPIIRLIACRFALTLPGCGALIAVIHEQAIGGPLQVVILPAAQRPPEQHADHEHQQDRN